PPSPARRPSALDRLGPLRAAPGRSGVGKGPVLVSSRSRLSTFSAEIRHIGNPTPGTVVAPAKYSPSTYFDVLAPRKNADCDRVCASPSALPCQALKRSWKSPGPTVCLATI